MSNTGARYTLGELVWRGLTCYHLDCLVKADERGSHLFTVGSEGDSLASMPAGLGAATIVMCLEFQTHAHIWKLIIRVFSSQTLNAEFLPYICTKDPEKGFLLGDQGYPCRSFLLTPYANPSNDTEQQYNRRHMSTRNKIERVFGIWKRKFHVLHSEIHMKPRKASRIIVACAVLYNLMMVWQKPVEEPEQDDHPQLQPHQGPVDGRGVRDYVANTHFARGN